MKCIILSEEITSEECSQICEQSYLNKNGKELPKKVKRVIGWKLICKSCPKHKYILSKT